MGRAGVTNHRHGQSDCHIHESSVPSCSASEDRAYTVHTDTTVGGEPAHRDGVVLACHPGASQGVVSPQPLTVECGTNGKVAARWNWPTTSTGVRRLTSAGERFEVDGDLSFISRWSRASDQTSDGLLSHTWDNATPSATYTIRVRMVSAQEGQEPISGPWTVRKSATCPSRFTPQTVNVVCDDWRAYPNLDNSGTEVITVTWEPVTSATQYRISGDFSYEGPPLESYTWQGEEGESYTLKVAAYMNGGWSSPSGDVTAQCYKDILRDPPSWDSPNTEEICIVSCHTVDPDPPTLVSRSCDPVSQMTPSIQTTRECTIVWNETIRVRTNSSWNNLPVVSHPGETIAGTFAAFILSLPLAGNWVKAILGVAAGFTGTNIGVSVYRDASGQGWARINGAECVNVDRWSPEEAEQEESAVDSTGLHTTNTTHVIKHCLKGSSEQAE